MNKLGDRALRGICGLPLNSRAFSRAALLVDAQRALLKSASAQPGIVDLVSSSDEEDSDSGNATQPAVVVIDLLGGESTDEDDVVEVVVTDHWVCRLDINQLRAKLRSRHLPVSGTKVCFIFDVYTAYQHEAAALCVCVHVQLCVGMLALDKIISSILGCPRTPRTLPRDASCLIAV